MHSPRSAFARARTAFHDGGAAFHDSAAGLVDGQQWIDCLHCGRAQSIARRAITITCKFCNKTLRLEPVSIATHHARRHIETCATVTIEKTGDVFADDILCGSLVLRGRLRGNVVSRGPVTIEAEAELRGDVTAPALSVGEGAVIEGDYRIGNSELRTEGRETDKYGTGFPGLCNLAQSSVLGTQSLAPSG
jgi:hypothetical protein